MSEALGRIQAAAKRTGGYSRSVLADDLREVVARVAKLEAALKEIGREQSAKTATVAADKFQSIARTALKDAPQ